MPLRSSPPKPIAKTPVEQVMRYSHQDLAFFLKSVANALPPEPIAMGIRRLAEALEKDSEIHIIRAVGNIAKALQDPFLHEAKTYQAYEHAILFTIETVSVLLAETPVFAFEPLRRKTLTALHFALLKERESLASAQEGRSLARIAIGCADEYAKAHAQKLRRK